MGLMDVLNGMRNGPRGQIAPSTNTGGMSPITMGLLALLAYKAYKGGGIFGTAPQPQGPSSRASTPASSGGSDWLSGLGSLLAGGGAGGILSGGLTELVKRLQNSGNSQVAHSWVSTGANHAIEPSDLERALGNDTLEELSRQTGASRNQVLSELTDQLPQTVDTLTPDGRLPNEQEAEQCA